DWAFGGDTQQLSFARFEPDQRNAPCRRRASVHGACIGKFAPANPSAATIDCQWLAGIIRRLGVGGIAMKTKLLAACVAAAMLPFVASAQADVLAYETSFSDFGIVNLTTGQFTHLGNGGQVYAGLGNYGGNLYAGINTGTNFYQVSPANGALTLIGNSGV